MSLCRRLVAAAPEKRFPDAESADLGRKGAAAFHRQLVKSDLASEYENDLRVWLEALGSVRKGDTVDLDLDPARGLLLSLNGTLRGAPVPGDQLYRALLRAFLGEHPYDNKLKAGLLAGLGRTSP